MLERAPPHTALGQGGRLFVQLCAAPVASSPVSLNPPAECRHEGYLTCPGSHPPKWQMKDCSPVPLTVGRHVHTSGPSSTAATLCSTPWPQAWAERPVTSGQARCGSGSRAPSHLTSVKCWRVWAEPPGGALRRPCARPTSHLLVGAWWPLWTQLSSPPLVRRKAMVGDTGSKASTCQASQSCAELHSCPCYTLEALVLRGFTWTSAGPSLALTPES